jgi:hypothetical protein
MDVVPPNDCHELASIAVTPEAERETLQHIPVEVDEIITSFAKTYAQMAELQRVLQRTYHRAEHALALARAIRRLRLGTGARCFPAGGEASEAS